MKIVQIFAGFFSLKLNANDKFLRKNYNNCMHNLGQNEVQRKKCEIIGIKLKTIQKNKANLYIHNLFIKTRMKKGLQVMFIKIVSQSYRI